ncbi:MAG TPA: T9SS type A sorting domain-containing protein [Ignavibacteriaceae bacterium]|nr:T9SS type A sorting domain-containing protein [Ignavibacteriaceae bacterium]
MKKYYLILASFFLISFIITEYIFKSSSPTIASNENEKMEPSEWMMTQRLFPYMQADPDAYLQALSQVKKMKQALRKSDELSWTFAGPVNIGGRITDIEFNPLNPNIVYCSAATGGVFKSTDKGETWFPVFDGQAFLSIGDIAVDPVNPDIIYVGTGEANGGHNNFPGGGMFKSTDAGSTWFSIGLDSAETIGRVIINPSNTNEIFVAAVGSYFTPTHQRGIFKSTDGGSTWNQSLFVSDSTGGIDILMDPTNPDFMLASMWERVRRPNDSHLFGPSSGIYKSTNNGESWQLLGPSTGLPNATTTNVGRIGLSISKTNPNISYALYNDGYVYSGLYKTTDYGNNWTNADPDMNIMEGVSNFSWYFGQVRINPSDPNKIYVMDVGFMSSNDAGANWNLSYETHVDHHALAFSPDDSNYLINGDDGGIYISTNGGSSWSGPKHMPNTQFYEIGLDYNNPLKLYGGTQDNNTLRTQTGNLDDWQPLIGGDGFYVIVDFTNPNIIYAESQNGYLQKSTDGGNNFFYARNGINENEPTNWSTPVVMDPNNSNVLYYGTDRVYRTTNGAGNWTVISPDLTDGIPGTRLGTVTTIDVAPSNSNVIYAGTDDHHVWVTTDYGSNWTDITGSLPYRWVTRVKVDPNNENNIYVTFSGLKWHDPQPHVFKSTNMGTNWTDISSNLPDAPVNAFAIDNNDPNRLYLGSDVGAFMSFNGGTSWQPIADGLPTVSVYDMKIHPVENYLAIGTHGRSMYKIDLGQLVNIKPGLNKIAGFKLSQNYPNPFNPSTRLSFVVGKSSFVTLKIYDVLGNEIAALVNEEKSPGTYDINFNASGLSSGVYYYRLSSGSFSETKKMIFLK